MAEQRVEFSVQAEPQDAAGWTELARRTEGLGMRALLVADHPGAGASPFVALAAAAAVTSTLRLGSYVVNAGVREPIHIAADVATLDVVSAGRAEVGLGAGHTPGEWEMIGRARPTASERVRHLTTTASAVRRLLDGQAVPAQDVGALSDLRLDEPRPVQDHVPLLVGGTSATMLRWAGGNADAVGLTGLGATRPDGHRHEVAWSPEQVDRHVARVREGADRAGRPMPGLEALVQVLAIADERQDVLAGIAADLETPANRFDDVPYILVGTREQILEQLEATRQRWGITRFVVRAGALEAAADLLAALGR
ncbi:LLM class flavin-dependent oxidoreductase [Pseudactinotalea sp. Z1739]|uniref:LLM class flavin-dependent oxidoreductase n=1 Tax=Pseudactinotalea sp. Z1739 TaxID=3413028 RepID=UPI003C7DAE12